MLEEGWLYGWVGRWVVISEWVTWRFSQGLKKVGCMDVWVGG